MSKISQTVFLTVPKFVTISPNKLPKLQPAIKTEVTEEVPRSESPVSSGYSSCDGAPKTKKRRLDHLTWEEKIQRKKLKNRVAAQTSRDRKKARMEEMEQEIQELNENTEILRNKCDSLMSINDTLMEKNRKLDVEVEALRNQLLEIKEQKQEVKFCAGCASLAHNGSAAGITQNGTKEHTIDTTTDCGFVENSDTLPSLQDMLLFNDIEDVNEEDFDASRLEELAESLLADITADLEASHCTSNAPTTQVASIAERLPRPVVGTPTECLESNGYDEANTINATTTGSASINLLSQQPSEPNELQSNTTSTPPPQLPQIQQPAHIKCVDDVADDTNVVYGTYDASTNSITIILDDNSEPCQEAVEEISSEGEETTNSPMDTMEQAMHVAEQDDDDSDIDDVWNFDPIEKFLIPKRNLITPLARSPTLSLASVASSAHDHGYESILSSPMCSSSTASEPFVADIDDDFTDFNDLFPNLI